MLVKLSLSIGLSKLAGYESRVSQLSCIQHELSEKGRLRERERIIMVLVEYLNTDISEAFFIPRLLYFIHKLKWASVICNERNSKNTRFGF